MRWWRDHSLTIVMIVIGISLIVISFFVEDDRFFDLFMGLGQGTLTAALLFFLSQWFRETAKPED
jgi:uncharacterized membrane protein YgaE (UPF0421/DUF939 family)